MKLYCAIDVRGGQAVRLVQGDFGRERHFGDPLELAAHYVASGASYLHVVDLDAARSGRPQNRGIVQAIVEAAGVPVQVGGGVRDQQDVAELVALGADRVVMGTTAVRQPEVARACAAQFPGRVALGLDYRRREDGVLQAAVSGWEEGSEASVGDVLTLWRGEPLAAIVLTAIDRDGTQNGPDLDALSWVLDLSAHDIVASGGVGSVDDLSALTALRSPSTGRSPSGVIVGMALLDGSIEVSDAVAVCTASE